MNSVTQEGPCSRLLQATYSAAPQVAMQLAADADRYLALAAALRINPPHGVLTLARGSPDHAAAYLAHLITSRTGQLVSALPLSLLALQRAPVASHGLLAIALAQSGRGQELREAMQTLGAAGATTVALVNDSESPLAQAAQWCLPLHAGPDTGMQADQGFICSLVAAARLCIHWPWGTHAELREGLQALPEALDKACLEVAADAMDVLCSAHKLLVIGQGAGLAIAQETALRLRASCGLKAEAMVCAEVRHGPLALVEPDAVVLVLALRGAAQHGLVELAEALRLRGARVLLGGPADLPGCDLVFTPAPHSDLDAITAMPSLYLLVEALARMRRSRWAAAAA